MTFNIVITELNKLACQVMDEDLVKLISAAQVATSEQYNLICQQAMSVQLIRNTKKEVAKVDSFFQPVELKPLQTLEIKPSPKAFEQKKKK